MAGDRRVTVHLEARVGGYVRSVEQAARATDRLHRRAEQFDGSRYTFSVDAVTNRAERSVGRLDGALGSLNRRGLDVHNTFQKLAIGSAVAFAPQLASLGGAAVTAAGSLALIPAAGFAAAAGVGAVALGLRGFGDALKIADPEKFAEAVRELAPSARATAIELRTMADDWRRLEQAVQQELFEGVADVVDDLGREYLPIVRTALAGVADELSDAAVKWGEFATSAQTTRDAADGLDAIRRATVPLGDNLTSLSQIFRDVAVVGSTFLPRLSSGLADVTGRWAAMVAEARRSGELWLTIDEGIRRTGQFVSVLADTAGIVGGVFDAADGAGIDFLTTLERVTAQTHAWVDSTAGQQQMQDVFRGLNEAVQSFIPGLRELAGLAATVISNLAESGTLVAAGDAFSAVAREARPVLEIFSELASAVLPPLLGAVERLAPLLGPVAAGFIAIKTARTGLRLAGLASDMGAVTSAAWKLAPAIAGAGGAFLALDGMFDLATADLDELATKLAAGEINLDQVRAAVEENETGWRGWLTGGLSPVGEKLFGVGHTVSDVEQRARELGGSVDAAAASTDRAAQAARDYDTALGTLSDRVFAAENADLAYRDSLDAVRDAQDRARGAAELHGTESREFEQAQRDVERALYDNVRAAGEKARADGEAAGASNAHELALLAQQERARELIGTLSGPMRRELENLAARLHGLPDGQFKVTAEGAVTFDTARKLLNNPNSYAVGGPVRGPGGPTDDRIPAMLSDGEYVVKASAASRYGVAALDQVNAGRAEIVATREHPVRGYATGGPVTARAGMRPFRATADHQAAVAEQAAVDWLAPRTATALRKLISETGGILGGGNGRGWRWQMDVLRGRFPGLQLISGFRPGAITATGNRSYHSMGRAVDVPPRMDVFNWLRANYGANTRELIFSPANNRQVHNGRPHMYTGVTRGDHWDHIHWAMDKGGILQSGDHAVNLSGRNERVLDPRTTVAFERLVDVISTPRSVAGVSPHHECKAGNTYQLTVHDAGNGRIDLETQFRRLELRAGL